MAHSKLGAAGAVVCPPPVYTCGSRSLRVPLHSSLIYCSDVPSLYLFLNLSVSVTLCSRSIVPISLYLTQELTEAVSVTIHDLPQVQCLRT